MSKDWKQWHVELNEAIEKPTNDQLHAMEGKHFDLYQLFLLINEKKEELDELDEKFKDLKETLNMDDLPEYCWIWMKKKSRISWKTEFINRLGETTANKISAAAKSKEHPQIGIQFIDPKPENIPIDPETKKRKEKPKRFELKKAVFTLE